MNLLERIEYVLQEKDWSADQWSKKAGLYRTHVNTILGRLKGNPNATIEVDTLEKLARAAEMPVDWFTRGKGSPVGDFVRVQEDQRYPTRGQAVSAARLWGWHPEAVRKVLADESFTTDPGLRYWVALLEAEHEAAHTQAPLGPSSAARGPSQGAPGARSGARRWSPRFPHRVPQVMQAS